MQIGPSKLRENQGRSIRAAIVDKHDLERLEVALDEGFACPAVELLKTLLFIVDRGYHRHSR